jgi:hypothetical protein
MQLQHVDISSTGVFEYGQMYVALSRATSLDGVYLHRFDAGSIRAHPRVIEFYADRDEDDDGHTALNDDSNSIVIKEDAVTESNDDAGAASATDLI